MGAIVAFLLFASLAFAQYSPPLGGSSACGALSGDVTGTCAATVLSTIPSSVQDAITRLGTIVSGVWNGTVIAPTYGGSGANLSATGGANQVVKQITTGAAFTVGTLASTNLSDTTDIVRGAAALDTAGYIPFITSAGTLTINKTAGQQLFLDNTNHRVGINNTAPAQALDVTGNISASGTVLAVSGNFASGAITIDTTNGVLAPNRAVTGGTLNTGTNCSSAASPAVCATAAAGSVAVAAAATTVTVNTTRVTANSQIFVLFDSSLGTKLGSITCNTTEPALYGVTARVAATSFTLTSTAPVTNPACFSYFILN